jgi:hypothetical protein
VLAALLFYFGWVRSDALYYPLGIDQTLLAFSWQDYLLRSTKSAFGFLRYLLLGAILFAWIHFGMQWFLASKLSSRRRFLRGLATCVFALPGGLLILASLPSLLPTWLRVPQACASHTLAVGTAALTYAAYLAMTWLFPRRPPVWLRNATVGCGIALALLGVFASAASYAQSIGYSRASEILSNPDHLPSVVLYSHDRLGINHPAVNEEELGSSAGAYTYRYTNLRFLVRTADKYFLLPGGTLSSVPVTFVLPDSPDLRVEVSPGSCCSP